jgi:hypothetical protein
MYAHKAPPSSLASLHSSLVPQPSLRRAPGSDALASERAAQRRVGSIPQGFRGGVDLVRDGRQSAARPAKGEARA